MIKILFFIPSISGGGAEKVLRNLVNNMDLAKYDITVQTIEQNQPEQYLKKDIHYKAINRCKTKIGKKLFEYWFRFCAETKLAYPFYVKGDYDIEIAYLECGATKVIAESTNRKALKVAWIHCDLSKKENIKNNLSKLQGQYRKFDKIVCVSEDVKRAYEELFENVPEAIVLHNVIDEDEIIRKSKEPIKINKDIYSKVFLAVGRLTYQKGFDHLIEACKKLKDDGYHFKQYILGEGLEKDNLERLIQQNHLEDTVYLLGFKKNPYPYMKMADYIICSSRYEGYSTVTVEALILGKIVITTPCTGMKELLGNSQYGMIAKNGIDGLYEEIKKILDSSSIEEFYSIAAKKRGIDFSKRKLIQMTCDFFDKEMNNGIPVE